MGGGNPVKRIRKQFKRSYKQIEEETKRGAASVAGALGGGGEDTSGPNSLSTLTDGAEGIPDEGGEGEDKDKGKAIGKKRKIGKKGTKINKVPLKAAGGVKI